MMNLGYKSAGWFSSSGWRLRPPSAETARSAKAEIAESAYCLGALLQIFPATVREGHRLLVVGSVDPEAAVL
jgi:hypothetical protein